MRVRHGERRRSCGCPYTREEQDSEGQRKKVLRCLTERDDVCELMEYELADILHCAAHGMAKAACEGS